MTKEEFWKNFKDGALYIHTPIEEQCMTFVQMSKENGIYFGLDRAEYFAYGENTYLGVVKKDDLDIFSRVMAESHFGKSIDCWLAYGTKEHVGHNQIIEFSEVFGDDMNEEESDLNIEAMLSYKLVANNTICSKAYADILICLSSIVMDLLNGGISVDLINMAVKEGIEHAKN